MAIWSAELPVVWRKGRASIYSGINKKAPFKYKCEGGLSANYLGSYCTVKKSNLSFSTGAYFSILKGVHRDFLLFSASRGGGGGFESEIKVVGEDNRVWCEYNHSSIDSVCLSDIAMNPKNYLDWTKKDCKLGPKTKKALTTFNFCSLEAYIDNKIKENVFRKAFYISPRESRKKIIDYLKRGHLWDEPLQSGSCLKSMGNLSKQNHKISNLLKWISNNKSKKTAADEKLERVLKLLLKSPKAIETEEAIKACAKG